MVTDDVDSPLAQRIFSKSAEVYTKAYAAFMDYYDPDLPIVQRTRYERLKRAYWKLNEAYMRTP